MSEGKIWPEWWIDCMKCDHHEPLGERDKERAIVAATSAGWISIQGHWICPRCVKAKQEENKLLDAMMQKPETVLLTREQG